MNREKVSYFFKSGRLKSLNLTNILNMRLTIPNFLPKRRNLLSKVFSCNLGIADNLSSIPAGAFRCPDDPNEKAKLALDIEGALRENAPYDGKV